MSESNSANNEKPIRVSIPRDSKDDGHFKDGICPKCARLGVCMPHHSLTDPVWYCDRFAVEPES